MPSPSHGIGASTSNGMPGTAGNSAPPPGDSSAKGIKVKAGRPGAGASCAKAHGAAAAIIASKINVRIFPPALSSAPLRPPREV